MIKTFAFMNSEWARNLCKAWLLVSACLFLCAAQAEWTELDKSDEATYYWDKDSVKAVHVTRYAWTMADLPKSMPSPAGEEYQSSLTRWRVHCKTDMFIKISESYYEKAKGKGREVASFDDPEWRIGERPIRPGTYVALLKKQLCANPGS
jgi:hypothetical protein